MYDQYSWEDNKMEISGSWENPGYGYKTLGSGCITHSNRSNKGRRSFVFRWVIMLVLLMVTKDEVNWTNYNGNVHLTWRLDNCKVQTEDANDEMLSPRVRYKVGRNSEDLIFRSNSGRKPRISGSLVTGYSQRYSTLRSWTIHSYSFSPPLHYQDKLFCFDLQFCLNQLF